MNRPPPLSLRVLPEPTRTERERGCKDCGACCDASAVPSLNKPAGKRCAHFSPGKGCTLYGKPERPPECAAFACLWLQGAGARKHRPDRLGVFLAVHVPRVPVEGQPKRILAAVETYVRSSVTAAAELAEIRTAAPLRIVPYPKEGTQV